MLIEFAEVRRRRRAECRVLECFLHQPLAVVEAAAHLQGMDIPAEGGELLFLQLAHASRGVEDDDVDVRPAVECLGNRASRVPAGGHEDLDPACLAPEKRLHGGGEELRTEILERARRAVEELQEEDLLVQPPKDGGKRKGAPGQRAGLFRGDVRCEQSSTRFSRDVLEGRQFRQRRHQRRNVRRADGWNRPPSSARPVNKASRKLTTCRGWAMLANVIRGSPRGLSCSPRTGTGRFRALPS